MEVTKEAKGKRKKEKKKTKSLVSVTADEWLLPTTEHCAELFVVSGLDSFLLRWLRADPQRVVLVP